MTEHDQYRGDCYIEQLHAVWAFEELFAEEQYRIEVLLEGCRERGDLDAVHFLRQVLRQMRLDQENLVRTSLERLHRSMRNS